MSHQTLPRTASSPRHPVGDPPTDAGAPLFLGGVVVIALLVVLIWVGLF